MTSDNKLLIVQDGVVEFLPGFLPSHAAAELYKRLEDELDWRAEWLRLGARCVQVPRLVCWYGDPGASYRYSGVSHEPQSWTPTLSALRTRLQAFTGQFFNSALGNYYRTGKDSMGWHADREAELGQNPYIASLSLGGDRLFKLRHKNSGASVDVVLSSGSLLLMHGTLQHHWRHCLPKTSRPVPARINLTFRRILLPRSPGDRCA